MANQKLAVDSIQKAFADTPCNNIFFSALDDLRKTKARSGFETDQIWGIKVAVANCDL